MKTNQNLSRLEGKKDKIKSHARHPELDSGSRRLKVERFRIKYGMTLCKSDAVSGFTLIELLVVVLIIGILAAVALPQYQMAVMKARYNELVTVTQAFARAAEAYYMENGDYGHIDNYDVNFSCNSDPALHYIVCGDVACGGGMDGHLRCLNQNTLNNGYAVTLNFGTFNKGKPGDEYCFTYSTNTADKYHKFCQFVSGNKKSFTYSTLMPAAGLNYKNGYWYKYQNK